MQSHSILQIKSDGSQGFKPGLGLRAGVGEHKARRVGRQFGRHLTQLTQPIMARPGVPANHPAPA